MQSTNYLVVGSQCVNMKSDCEDKIEEVIEFILFDQTKNQNFLNFHKIS